MRLDHLLSKEDTRTDHEFSKEVNSGCCSILRVPEEVPLKKEFGGLAQLGEHLLCKQGVKGSIPLISTSRDGDSEPVSGVGKRKRNCLVVVRNISRKDKG